jgi:hypothetical protein
MRLFRFLPPARSLPGYLNAMPCSSASIPSEPESFPEILPYELNRARKALCVYLYGPSICTSHEFHSVEARETRYGENKEGEPE